MFTLRQILYYIENNIKCDYDINILHAIREKLFQWKKRLDGDFKSDRITSKFQDKEAYFESIGMTKNVLLPIEQIAFIFISNLIWFMYFEKWM